MQSQIDFHLSFAWRGFFSGVALPRLLKKEACFLEIVTSGYSLKPFPLSTLQGQFVNEYVGELIDVDECDRRIKQQHDDDVNDFYMLTLTNGRYKIVISPEKFVFRYFVFAEQTWDG